MTKVNTALLEQLLTNAEISANQSIIDFITNTLENSTNKSVKHPNIIDENGNELKYCSRHLEYELLTEYKQQKSGKYETCCDVALKQWRQYDKDMKSKEKLMLENNDPLLDSKFLAEFKLAKEIRGGKYEYPTEEVEKEKEEQEVQKPKKRSK